jgi:hypothetical protein
MPISDPDIEFIFLGTGTSSSLPHVDCLTRPPDARRCRTCLSTLTPAGKKNCRRNTSGVVRMKGNDGQPMYVCCVLPLWDYRNEAGIHRVLG